MVSRLNDSEVMQVRLERQQGASLKELAEKYRVSAGTVSRIARGDTHRHLPVLMTPQELAQGQRAVSDTELRTILRRWRNGDNMAEVAKEYGLDRSTLSNYIAKFAEDLDERTERVLPDKGARYRDALVKIAEMDTGSNTEAVRVARKALGMAMRPDFHNN